MFEARDMLIKGKAGYSINPLFQHIFPYSVGFDPEDVPALPFQIPTAGTVCNPVGFRAPRSSIAGCFEGDYITFADSAGIANSAWTIRFQDLNGRFMSNQPIHIRTLAGSAQLPAILREPLILLSRDKFNCVMNKITGAAVNVRIQINGSQLQPGHPATDQRIAQWTERRKLVYPFWYTTAEPVTLTALQNNANYDVMVGENFEAFSICAVSTGAFAMEITEVRSGKTISNGRWTGGNGMGDATLPTVFAKPYLVPLGSRLRFTFEDLSNGANSIYVALQGRVILAPLKDARAAEQDSRLKPLSDFYRANFPETVGV